jgi:glycolate oxidase FAD binding subunit
VKPSDGPKLASLLGHDVQLQFDWGGGLVWACVSQGTDVRAVMNGIDGHATLVRSNEATAKQLGVFHPEPAPLANISAGLRSRFDPHGVLNPGRMG